MSSNDIILAIESSCDETSAAVLRDGTLAAIRISSQADHASWGGVVPELAARAHLRTIVPIIESCMKDADVEFSDINAVAVTNEPGLIGSLLVGLNVAKGISISRGIPLIAVNHIEAHLLSVLIDSPEITFPYIALVVSGGHTLLYDVRAIGEYVLLGSTRDDAAGEAFDKGAKLLGLGYPGGPIVDSLARTGRPDAINFPRGLTGRDSLDFSFSGVKTSLKYYLRDNYAGKIPPSDGLPDICASYQEAIVDALVNKSMHAIEQLSRDRVAVVGGVSVNSRLRAKMSEACSKRNVELHTTKPIYGTDNAAMIAIVAWHKFKSGVTSPLSTTARASTIRSKRK